MATLFVSHSSRNKDFAERLMLSLQGNGHSVWLDKYEIRVGESITSKIQEGLQACDYVVLVLTKHAVESRWVEREWQAKFWDQVSDGRVYVLPVLLEPCDRPAFLKDLRYADFTKGYSSGLAELLDSITPGTSGNSGGTAIRSELCAPEVTALLAKAHSRDLPLSSLLIEVLSMAQRRGNHDVERFCREELGGLDRARGGESEEDCAKRRPWRVIECFASTIGEANPHFHAFQASTSMFQYMERHPREFVPMRLIWTKTVAETEDEGLRQSPTSTAAVLRRKHRELVEQSKTPEAEVYIYIRPDYCQRILRGTRRELITHLLSLLPAVPPGR